MKSTKSLFGLLLLLLAITSCNGPTNVGEEVTGPATSLNGLVLSGTVPRDVAVGAADSTLAKFAWNEFFALNWQADTSNSTVTRGTAQSGWAFTDGNPNTTVWETYLHRTELININSLASTSYETGSPVYNNYSHSPTVKDPDKFLELGRWNLLDEDNEIGSCFLFYIDGQDTIEVLYQAKANLSEYKYLKHVYPTADERNDAVNVIAKDTSLLVTFAMDNLFCAQDTANANAPADFKKTICFPCGDASTNDEGSIEIKTAWRELTKNDDPTKFITREVVYFKKEPGKNTRDTVVTNATFMALIGMHVIHKTRNYPAYIFATWEHESVRKVKGQYQFIPDLNLKGVPFKVYDVLDRIPATIPSQVDKINGYADQLIKQSNTNSVLQYYNLVGVQATPIDYDNNYKPDSTNIPGYAAESSFFLANYVIESDFRLTDFHGSFADPDDENKKNVVWRKGVKLNMGGCQGCHGEANNMGKNFSFLIGGAVTEPDIQQSFKEAYAEGKKNAGLGASLTEEDAKKLQASLEK